MISRRSSGSRRVESAVEPTRSQNITVSWRRSAASVRGGGGDEPGGAGAVTSPTGFPQPPQNLAVGSFSKPQAAQGDGSGVPHWAQKRLVVVFSALQLGQRIQTLSRANERLKHISAMLSVEAEARSGSLAHDRRYFQRRMSQSGHLRQIGSAPQVRTPQVPQKPWEVSHRGMRSCRAEGNLRTGQAAVPRPRPYF